VSIDRRLRAGFERSAPAIAPNGHTAFERVRVRARRTIVIRRVTSISIAALVVGVAVFAGPTLLYGFREPDGRQLLQQPTPSVPAVGGSAIAGSFTTTLGDEDPAVQSNQMAGEWTVTFRSDGVLEVSPPDSFQQSHAGYSFEVSGDVFRTDLFRTDVCNDQLPGRYRWQRNGERLTFEAVDETCPAREALFTGDLWDMSAPPT
jgi:hypothetical protein